MTRKNAESARSLELGMKKNWAQFTLLVLINAFVGGMVGLERTVVPLIGAEEFHIHSATLVSSFIVSFGLVKAFANLVSGQLADSWGRKPVLVLGWLLGLPVPWMIMVAPNWNWVLAANVLLGLNQGLAWSMTVVMKIDLVGPRGRGLAVGLNEFAGYIAVGATAFATGYVASRYSLRPAPLYIGVIYSVLGCILSIGFVRDSLQHARLEARQAEPISSAIGFKDVFAMVTYKNRNLFSASQAGLVNNLNDGMSWGIFPLFFAAAGLGVARIGQVKAVYPIVWGMGQIITGPLSDRLGRKGLIVAGMWIQAVALFLTATSSDFGWWIFSSILLGAGTAMVYPCLIAAVSDASHPSWRAKALSVYRFWRDLGYAVGALLAGLIADRFGFASAIAAVGALTFFSGTVVAMVMVERPSDVSRR
ncbi:MAG: MFS transporter [Proteobacteria bacterium]|nr:MFS transporter [Pseudomonadota bacterium]